MLLAPEPLLRPLLRSAPRCERGSGGARRAAMRHAATGVRPPATLPPLAASPRCRRVGLLLAAPTGRLMGCGAAWAAQAKGQISSEGTGG